MGHPEDTPHGGETRMKTRSVTARETLEQRTRFPHFDRLPAELRIMVWTRWIRAFKETEDFHPFRVRPYMGRKKATSGGHKWQQTVKLTPMAELGEITRSRREMLLVCREARYEAMRLFPDVLEFHDGGLFRFEATNDIIYLDIIDPKVIHEISNSTHLEEHDQLAFTKTIQNVAFDMMALVPRWQPRARFDVAPKLDFILSFPALKSVFKVAFDPLERMEVDFMKSYPYYRGWHIRRDIVYDDETKIGNIDAPPRHVCIYCAVSKCEDLRLRMKGQYRHASDPELTNQEKKRLGEIKFLGLISMEVGAEGIIDDFEGVDSVPMPTPPDEDDESDSDMD